MKPTINLKDGTIYHPIVSRIISHGKDYYFMDLKKVYQELYFMNRSNHQSTSTSTSPTISNLNQPQPPIFHQFSGSTISTNRYMIESTLKIARYCPLVSRDYGKPRFLLTSEILVVFLRPSGRWNLALGAACCWRRSMGEWIQQRLHRGESGGGI